MRRNALSRGQSRTELRAGERKARLPHGSIFRSPALGPDYFHIILNNSVLLSPSSSHVSTLLSVSFLNILGQAAFLGSSRLSLWPQGLNSDSANSLPAQPSPDLNVTDTRNREILILVQLSDPSVSVSLGWGPTPMNISYKLSAEINIVIKSRLYGIYHYHCNRVRFKKSEFEKNLNSGPGNKPKCPHPQSNVQYTAFTI